VVTLGEFFTPFDFDSPRHCLNLRGAKRVLFLWERLIMKDYNTTAATNLCTFQEALGDGVY
jgi:hypothetical protein